MTDYSLALSRDRPSHDRDAFSRRHPKMSLQNRAKIFAPFDALPDLRWKVAERQKITRPPARLTEDARELLDRKLRWLDRYAGWTGTAGPIRIVTGRLQLLPLSISSGIPGRKN